MRSRRDERIPSWRSAGDVVGSGDGGSGIRHEAWLYRGVDEFIDGSLAFVTAGLEAGEDVMVATTPQNLAGLRHALSYEDERLSLVDMSRIGRNPGRILSVWREFLGGAEARGRAARGIGEPVWADRTADEVEECRRHEALINDAFQPEASFWLLCPYDRSVLGGQVLASVESTHPAVYDEGARRESQAFDRALGGRALDGELPPAPASAERLPFGPGALSDLRGLVRAFAVGHGIAPDRADDLVFAVNELAANAIRHGGGHGTVMLWRMRPKLVVCEVADEGRIHDPLVGRAKPPPEEPNGRGLWIVHELCDLVQARSSAHGTRVRVSMSAHP